MFYDRALYFGVLILSFEFFVIFAKAEAEIDCRQRPRKLIKTSVYCCETPERNLDDYKDLCFQLKENNTLRCQLDCLFHVTNAIEDETLNLAKLHKMLESIFPNASDFVAAFYISFEECIPLVRALAAEAQSHMIHKPHCEPFAIFYVACAQMKLLKNCPKDAWNSRASCESARSFVTKCENNLLPKRRKHKTGAQLRVDSTAEFNASFTTIASTLKTDD